MDGRGRCGPRHIVDSSRFSASWFTEWQHVKYGKLSVHDFAKLRLVHTPYGKA